MSGETPDPGSSERARLDTEELVNPQPDLARPENDAPRRTGNESVYFPGDGAPANDVDEAGDTGQQVISELRERQQAEKQ
jgi:hypothetical protein